MPFIEKTGCVSCHHNSLPAMAAAMARERGFKLSERTAREESEQVLGVWNAGREKLLQGDGFGGARSSASYVLVGLAANKQPPNKTTDAIVYYLIGRQVADGRWPVATNRPPSESSDIAVTALSLRALQLYAPKGLLQEVNTRVERARQWLAKAAPRHNEDRAFQLLGLAWANADKQALQKMAQTLLAQQHKDGGWGQPLTLESDSFESICNGACGYLLKETPPAKLLEAIREAHEGGSPMSPEIARQVVALFQRTGPPEKFDDQLTPHEARLLELLAQGYSYQGAADQFKISVNTVRSHIRNIYDKLHVHSKSEAVSKALRNRLIF